MDPDGFKITQLALAGVAQWIQYLPVNQKVAGSIRVRVHAGVASRFPSCGYVKGNRFLFLSPCLSALSIIYKCL